MEQFKMESHLAESSTRCCVPYALLLACVVMLLRTTHGVVARAEIRIHLCCVPLKFYYRVTDVVVHEDECVYSLYLHSVKHVEILLDYCPREKCSDKLRFRAFPTT